MHFVQQAMAQEASSARLPTNVVPSHYHLTIRPEINEFTFSGSETVQLQVREPTSTIVLNALDIAIQSAIFVSGQGKPWSFALSCFRRSSSLTVFTV